MDLTQLEADRLMAMDKVAMEVRQYHFPTPGKKLEIPLVSRDEKERFTFSIYRGKRSVLKCTYQELHGGQCVLVRLDLNGPKHTNPQVLLPPEGFDEYNGTEFTESHLHLYVEGYDDKWALPASDKGFIEVSEMSHLSENLMKFLDFCNVRAALDIIGVLI